MTEAAKKYKLWICAQKHVYESPVLITEVLCGRCLKGRVAASKAAMKPCSDPPP